ncbi:MAG: ISNCY family transposase [DPANN group archaeon]|nr:ISNCY family transposase [DPANN group archaeon]
MTKRSKEVRLAVARLDEIIGEYKKEHPAPERDWRTYEQQFARRAKTAFHDLEPLVEQAVSSIKIESGENRGNEPKLTLKQKVLVLLLKHFCGKSNRMMEWMVVMFSLLTNIDVSYKTIERLYSDEAVRLAIFNLHSLLLKKKGIEEADCGGDGTGHALLVSQHYATSAKKLKDKAKEVSGTVKFVYSFALIDIKERMYIGYGISFKSEKEAFERALALARKNGIKVNSLRLDRYYSGEAYVNICQEALGNVKMYIIPKKNIASLGVGEWCRMVYAFVEETKAFLREYFQRNQSESGFSEDKKRTGWKFAQKREERVDTAYGLTTVWHNLFWVGA